MNGLTEFFKKDYTRNFFKLFSGMVVAQGLSLALSPLLSRLFTPEDFGVVAFYLAVSGLLSFIATCKYEQAIMLPDKPSDAAAILFLVLVLTTGFSIFLTLMVIIIQWQLNLSFLAPMGYWIWFLPLSVWLQGVFLGFNFMANRNKNFGIMASVNVFQHAVLNASRVIAGVLKLPFNGLVFAQILAPMASTGLILQKVLPGIRNDLRKISTAQIRIQMQKYSQYPRFNLMQSIMNHFASSLPIFMFTWGFSAEAAGLYAFGYTFVFRPLSLFSQSTLQVLSQKIIEDHHSGKNIYPGIKNLVLQFFKFGIGPFIIIGIFAPNIFSLLFSPVWTEAGKMIQILLPWLFIVYLTSPLSFIPELFFRQKKSMVIDIISVFLRFAALYTGIYFDDLYLALSLFSLVSFLVVGYALWWYLQLARNQQKV
jgi:O-antigen/teichoic acid export membrane protein